LNFQTIKKPGASCWEKEGESIGYERWKRSELFQRDKALKSVTNNERGAHKDYIEESNNHSEALKKGGYETFYYPSK